MARIQADEQAASKVLAAEVRFVRNDAGIPIRAVVDHRWATPLEWIALRRAGIRVAPKLAPAPERPHRETSCPCSGCGRCACAWIDGAAAPCGRRTCICARRRPPVRLAVTSSDGAESELVLTRGSTVLCSLGRWTSERGWDFAAAGDAKARSLPSVIHLVIRRAALAALPVEAACA